jgi:hypothetical protein
MDTIKKTKAKILDETVDYFITYMSEKNFDFIDSLALCHILNFRINEQILEYSSLETIVNLNDKLRKIIEQNLQEIEKNEKI